ncbi:MAG TPA: hypothetical protein VHL58_01100 [Thermoanaerobaculia bacterium]|nr:hypothetical protein [Thermoanaerobaculia bacterium]
MAEIDELRELAKSFWAKEDLLCPRHPGVKMKGSFIQTTYADHIYLDCPKGKETITIPQRPRQQEFNGPQIEGLVVFLQQGDRVLCYRCQSKLVIDQRELQAGSGINRLLFTCVRCLSYGAWEGKPEEASIEAHSASRKAS